MSWHTASGPSPKPVGNTPIRRIELRIGGRWRAVWLKLEGANPAGSIKDRTAWSLIDALDRAGRIGPNRTVVESTSGNLGVALAMICQARGSRFIAVVDPTISAEILAKLRAYGADVEHVGDRGNAGKYLLTRLERVHELCASSSQYVWTNQYGSPANPSAHFGTTGPEIRQQLAGRLDAIFIAVSTGGTLAGISRYLRRAAPRVQIVAVDAHGSRALGCVPGRRLLTGIGSGRTSEFVTADLYDETFVAADSTAFAICRLLLSELGLSVGGSSGAAIAAAAEYLLAHPKTVSVVCVCPDTGENYRSSIFNDEWLRGHGITLSSADLAPITGVRAGPPGRTTSTSTPRRDVGVMP